MRPEMDEAIFLLYYEMNMFLSSRSRKRRSRSARRSEGESPPISRMKRVQRPQPVRF